MPPCCWLLLLLLISFSFALKVKENKETCQTPSEVYAVYGAFGELGLNLLDFLKPTLTLPHKIRIILRQGQKQQEISDDESNVEYVSSSNLTEAFSNIHGAFIIPTLPFATTKSDFFSEANKSLELLELALLKSNVPKLVVLSSMGAHLDPNQHAVGSLAVSHWVEARFSSLLLQKATQLIFVRPGWDLENFRSFATTITPKQFVLPSFLKSELQVEMISNYDVALFMAQMMLKNPNKNKIQFREVAMKDKLSAKLVASALGRELKREIQIVGVPEEEYALFFKYMGPSALAEYRKLILAYNNGIVRFELEEDKIDRIDTKLDEVVHAWFQFDNDGF